MEIHSGAQTGQEFQAPRRVGRRAFFGLAGGSAASLLLAACGGPRPDADSKPVNISAGEPQLPTIQASTIDAELKRLRESGIVPDAAEQNLWSKNPFVTFRPRELKPEQADAAIRPKFGPLIDKMLQSKNPYFKSSAETIRGLMDDSSFFFNIIPQSPRGANLGSSPYLDEKSGKIGYVINLYTDPLYGVSELGIATGITHEITHIKNYKQAIDALVATGKPQAEVLESLASKYKSKSSCADEEAGAYAEQSRAYLYEKALAPNHSYNFDEIVANEFLKSGANPSDPIWRNTVARMSDCQ